MLERRNFQCTFGSSLKMTWLRVLCALFLAGALAEHRTSMELEAGSSFAAYVETYVDKRNVKTCELLNPQGDIYHFFPEKEFEDEKYKMREATHFVGCSAVIKHLDINDNGVWELTANINGRSITQSYMIRVLKGDGHVSEAEDVPEGVIDLIWRPGQAIDLVVGPANAVFCKVYDPSRHLSSEGFGRCHIKVPRVMKRHSGLWKLVVWTPGKVFPEVWEVRVIMPPTDVALVSTDVEEHNDSSLLLSCVALSKSTVIGCQFESPQNREYLVTPDSVEGRYSYYEAKDTIKSIRSESGFAHCGLNISNPVVLDEGRWRCTVVTEEQTFYGFLNVNTEHADSDITPRAIQKVVTVDAGERPVIGCSVPAAIRYCYFTAGNGSIYSVWPGSENYVGKGFDAGECMVMLPPARGDDASTWTCTVALLDPTAPETSTNIHLEVTTTPVMTARTLWNGNMSSMQIEGFARFNSPLEYCRFVRSDGLGFTVGNAPARYEVSGMAQNRGVCMMVVSQPISIDLRSWTVVAKIESHMGELSVTTQDILELLSAPPYYTTYSILLILIVVTTICVFSVGMLMGPKKNREWTYRQASNVRQSFRQTTSQTNVDQNANALPIKA